ncbi:10151_t:CDS:1 [Paraglomus occultum]|uniref:10151_t:CDS:1 n=1 Tax=Paraglomus occultum TaxID=144539 RepID=A0A9N9AGI9_9GLOM|nr:10151_t:CDS:1 [Paraglomus occultum]
MFACKLQAIWILIILLAVSVKSSTANLVIADKTTKNFTNVTAAIAPDSGGGYPTHLVSMVVRGFLTLLTLLRLHWVDWTQQSKWHEDIDFDSDWVLANFTSPSWAAGYYYETHTYFGDENLTNILWWDGWVNGIYCNNLYFYLKHIIDYKLSYHWKIIWGQDCSYPLK